ncbi:Hypothetical protein NTJ_00114 [Nesidiocoris tenuis]|uniref:Uncharacterized protein n=1 Tax=Nesidiocoris tenuis TaxID=355587 RepID=A0ABN7A5E3_9HEMI|nr:Hypothetical protein NTJ_00114 [Nesidiocoris tenuis]
MRRIRAGERGTNAPERDGCTADTRRESTCWSETAERGRMECPGPLSISGSGMLGKVGREAAEGGRSSAE